MKGGLWLNRQQIKWLVVLLALLPLIPTALLVRVLMEEAVANHETAAGELLTTYEEHIRQLAERYSTSTATPSPSQLQTRLEKALGSNLAIEVSSADETDPSSHPALSYQIQTGASAGWTVTLNQVPEFTDHQEEHRAKVVKLATGVIVGVILVAGCVWFAVHRQLRIDDLRTDLVTTVSHEMKTPIAASRVLLETLCHGNPDKSTTREYLALLEKENDRMAELAEQFLTFARLDNGQLHLSLTDCSVSELITEQVELIRPQFEEKGGQIQVPDEADLSVLSDPFAIRIILSNLLENALKYGGTPPLTHIASGLSGRRFWISVTDNGEGISTENRSQIFQEFNRGDRPLSSGAQGVGLGLAISQRLVKLLGGSIEATRQDDSRTCFTVSIPIA